MKEIVFIYGTRPEIIRLSELIKSARKFFSVKLINTGQNFHSNLNENFEVELGLGHADFYLKTGNSDYGQFIGATLSALEAIFSEDCSHADAIIILGDTYSALAAAFVAAKRGVKIFHIEAGNRCNDRSVPEEINRVMVDQLSDVNCAYSDFAKQNLIMEGFSNQATFVVGSPLSEVYDVHAEEIARSSILKDFGLSKRSFVVLSLHRAELCSRADLNVVLKKLFEYLNSLDMPIIASMHPRIVSTNLIEDSFQELENFFWHKPFSFFEYAKLIENSFFVVSDSGSIAEEASILGFDGYSFRRVTERQEAVEAGSIKIVGYSAKNLANEISALDQINPGVIPSTPDYRSKNFSQRMISIIKGVLVD